MARTLDRPKVHPEVHPDIHPDIHPDVDEFISKTLDESAITEQPRRPIRWMRWLAAALFLMAAAGVAVIMTSGDDTEYAVPSSADAAERWALAEPATAAVPSGSSFDAPIVDAVEVPMAETVTVELPSGLTLEVPMPETVTVELPSGLTLEVPMAETVTVELPSGLTIEAPIVEPVAPMAEPVAVVARVPHTADGYEAWLQYLDPRVPRSADGYEGWLLSTPLIDRLGVDVLRTEDYLPPESTGAVYNYNPLVVLDVLRIEDYLPPESTGAVYNYNPARVTEALPSGSPFDATVVELEPLTASVPSGSPFDAPMVYPQLVEVRMLPIAAQPGVTGDVALEVTYLPVTQVLPAVVTPETPVVLNVQPILVEVIEGIEGIEVASVPRSADGLEGWIRHLDPRVPRTADGAEGWVTGH